VHVLPRREGDFEENDDVYSRLATHDREAGGWRDQNAMTAEASELRRAWSALMM
jgi:hypothetical protein